MQKTTTVIMENGSAGKITCADKGNGVIVIRDCFGNEKTLVFVKPESLDKSVSFKSATKVFGQADSALVAGLVAGDDRREDTVSVLSGKWGFGSRVVKSLADCVAEEAGYPHPFGDGEVGTDKPDEPDASAPAATRFPTDGKRGDCTRFRFLDPVIAKELLAKKGKRTLRDLFDSVRTATDIPAWADLPPKVDNGYRRWERAIYTRVARMLKKGWLKGSLRDGFLVTETGREKLVWKL